jgi:CDP-paratose 2-epimerase
MGSTNSAKPLALVTGSCGLIGSEVSVYFSKAGFRIAGIDSNARAEFFGPEGDTSWVYARLKSEIPGYQHFATDIRNRAGILELVSELRPALIIHTAAQPSHDRAAAIPFDDFDTNAGGTLNLLESVRRYCPESPFIHMSTNKVYGDRPNTIAMKELDERWDYADPEYANGIPETFSIDQSKHSLFGASKVAGDVMVQEYGRYFNIPTCCLRGGCLTGPSHSGVELHGFLSYLIKCNIEGREYKVFGYKGKQVRDNIHSEDVARFMMEFWKAPRIAEVYNLGGGKENSCSILEAFKTVAAITGRKMNWHYLEENRIGDHICYYSDLRKMKAHYPAWGITKSLQVTFEEIAAAWTKRLSSKAQ